MRNLILRLLLDITCYASVTVVLLQKDYNIAAALIGSFGIVYVINAIRYFIFIRKLDAIATRELDALIDEMRRNHK